MTRPTIACVLLAALGAAASAGGEEVVLRNPTGRDVAHEAIRLPLTVPEDAETGQYAVEREGKAVPCQLGPSDGRNRLWVLTSLDSGQTAICRVRKTPPPKTASKVSVRREGDSWVLGNGLLAVRVPAVAGDRTPPPVEALRLGNKWVGAGQWQTDRKLRAFDARVLGNGPVFAKVRLRYRFEGTAGLYDNVPAFAEVDVTVVPQRHHVIVEEAHEMARGDAWVFDAAAGWGARSAICIPHSGGFERPDLGPWPPDSLKPGQTRMGKTLLNLMPRWTQAYDEGWLFACHDGERAAGAMVVHAGQWYWPHNNMIAARVRKTADYAGLHCPTWKGRRTWFLLAGPAELWQGKAAKAYVTRNAFQSLDKLNNDYVLTWPGLAESLAAKGSKRKPKLGGFRGQDFFSSGMNPTGMMRSFGRRAVRDAGKPGNLDTLTHTQVLFDPDCYGSYWNYWSPENPNFFTDFMRGPIAMTARLKGHPQFKRFAERAEQVFREDLYHSITLPGGAGQECPGYVAHAMKSWAALAPLCREHLGFDPTTWPRYSAGASFLLHLSQPIAPGRRRCHPGGDTHPLGPDVMEIAEKFGADENVRDFRTEELPGFGVVFRNRPGTDRETYLAFKSGPNRGHYHGDQLSFHYCADARQVAIDHMCSYAPRAGAEHMHNRVAFHTDKLPWANMDGYERVIAFKTADDADAAVGQVESHRLRVTTEYPPEGWDVYLPRQPLETPLRYRRTVVAMKNGPRDYFVIRDQYVGPPGIKATWCLHVLGDACRRKAGRIEFGNLTVVCAAPRTFEFGRHDWDFKKVNKKTGETIIHEKTAGVRLTVSGEAGEFITVLYPGGETPPIEPVDGGVRVGGDEVIFAGGIDDRDATAYVTARRDGKILLSLTGKDVDTDRSQGQIGLFVPDAGYPFGTIPDWLIRQRNAVPAWAPDRARALRAGEMKAGRVPAN